MKEDEIYIKAIQGQLHFMQDALRAMDESNFEVLKSLCIDNINRILIVQEDTKNNKK